MALAYRVALFCFYPGSGGAEKSLLRLSKVLRREGFDACLLFASLGGELDVSTENYALLSRSHLRRASFLRKLTLAFKLRWWLHKNRISIVISTLPLADEIVMWSGFRPRIFRIANLYAEDLYRLDGLKRHRRERRYKSLYAEETLVVLTDVMRSHFEEYFHSENVTTINNFIDEKITHESRNQARAEEPYVIHIGRFVPQKRHEFLLETWALNPRLPRLYLMCTPVDDLVNMICDRNLADRVSILGYRQDPCQLVSESQALVLCSEYEGFPSVLIEAMAWGTRVISTSCSGVADEILRDIPGSLSADSPEEFGYAIESALKRPVPSYQDQLIRYNPKIAATKWSQLIMEKVNI